MIRLVNRLANTKHQTNISYDKCFAKSCSDGSPGTSVFDHCWHAGAIAQGLLGYLSPSVTGRLPANPAICVAAHDIGKVSPGFQGKYFKNVLATYAPEWVRRSENGGTSTLHAEVGAAALKIILNVDDEHPIVRAVAAHHGAASRAISLNADGDSWQFARTSLWRSLTEKFGGTDKELALCDADAGLLAGLTCVADWLASDEEFFDPARKPYTDSELSAHVSAVVAEAGFKRHAIRKGLSFKDVFGFEPRDEQRKLFDLVDGPGVYVMEASMGAGKTEAALYAAYRLLAYSQSQGIFLVI